MGFDIQSWYSNIALEKLSGFISVYLVLAL